jgi:hypothetical protein
MTNSVIPGLPAKDSKSRFCHSVTASDVTTNDARRRRRLRAARHDGLESEGTENGEEDREGTG